MRIELKIDSKGVPYLELECATILGRDVRSDLLERFISLAREKGLVIKNESSLDSANDYASIRVNEQSPQGGRE